MINSSKNILLTLLFMGCTTSIEAIQLQKTQLLLDEKNTINGLDNPRIARMTPSGDQVLVASADDDALAIYELDNNFRLTFKTLFKNNELITGFRGATKLVIAKDGKRVFLVSFYDSSLVVFDRDSTGNFQYQQTITDGIKWFKEDGSTVSVSQQLDSLGLLGAYDIAISPDNTQLYIASSASNALSVFNLSSEKKVINEQIIRDNQDENYALQSAVSVISAQNNIHVFVASYEENAISVFTRSNTGKLEYLQTLRNEQHNIAKLLTPHGLAISADSRFLYVACSQSVVVFRKDNGKYNYLQNISNNDTGVSGLSGAASLALSADERYIFVASEMDGALVTLKRSTNGLLHFHSMLKKPELEGASSVTLSTNGDYLFVTAGNEGNSLSTYKITQ
jgi:6-phosphogluconolactonase (cycloisomerase 2 family)